ncbi:hypothetical protein HanIR_Chr04g0182821 [Helianthus annuus]|nr:hypothetical protein HanIR_Chr04g0182821 [Helianthus annuus]
MCILMKISHSFICLFQSTIVFLVFLVHSYVVSCFGYKISHVNVWPLYCLKQIR